MSTCRLHKPDAGRAGAAHGRPGGGPAAAPTHILITYAEDLRSLNVTVKGPGGADITNGPALINLSDRTNGSVPIHPAGNGRYEVDWNNVSNDDGDPDSGTFFFTAGANAAPAPAAPATTQALFRATWGDIGGR